MSKMTDYLKDEMEVDVILGCGSEIEIQVYFDRDMSENLGLPYFRDREETVCDSGSIQRADVKEKMSSDAWDFLEENSGDILLTPFSVLSPGWWLMKKNSV